MPERGRGYLTFFDRKISTPEALLETTASPMASLQLLFAPLVLLVSLSAAFEIVDKSPDLLVREGEELSLACEADVEFFTCTWHHVPTGKKCTMLSGSMGGRNTCQSDERYSWETSDPRRCQLRIAEASRDVDAGEHRCTLIFFSADAAGDGGKPQSDIANVTVRVARPARPVLGGDLQVRMEEGEEMPVMTTVAGEQRVLQCSSESADPKGRLSLFLFKEVEDTRVLEPLEMEDHQNEDGTFYGNVSAMFVPSPSDCGKTLCCDSVQFLAGEQEEPMREKACAKVRVRFPPQPSTEPFGPYGFTDDEDSIRIDLHFLANPVPENNRAIWHLTPREGLAGPGAQTMVLQAGSVHDSGKYEAEPLDVSGHRVSAGLVIRDLSPEDVDFEYALHVSNELGEERYAFSVVRAEDYGGDSYLGGEEDPDARESEGATGEEQEDVQEGGVGTGTIVGICIVVVAIAGIALLVFWAKSKEKMCFKPKGKKKEKEGDHPELEEGMQPPGEGQPLKEEKSVRAEAEKHQHEKANDVD